nr:ATP-binding protein [Phytoactinopolyspora endophytica]
MCSPISRYAGSLDRPPRRPAACAENNQMSCLDFLGLVTGEEAGVKDDRHFRNQLRLARLPHQNPLDELDFTLQPELDVRKNPYQTDT